MKIKLVAVKETFIKFTTGNPDDLYRQPQITQYRVTNNGLVSKSSVYLSRITKKMKNDPY